MLMSIEVLQEHIDRAGRTCRDCPVALALREALTFPEVVVDEDEILLDDHMSCVSCDTPEVVRDFIDRYDGGHHVRPFTFYLEVPDGR